MGCWEDGDWAAPLGPLDMSRRSARLLVDAPLPEASVLAASPRGPVSWSSTEKSFSTASCDAAGEAGAGGAADDGTVCLGRWRRSVTGVLARRSSSSRL